MLQVTPKHERNTVLLFLPNATPNPVNIHVVTIRDLHSIAMVMRPRIDSRWQLISSDKIDPHDERRAILTPVAS
jgi:hypothetical protein